jgi:hypothetical protein
VTEARLIAPPLTQADWCERRLQGLHRDAGEVARARGATDEHVCTDLMAELFVDA